MNVDLNDKDVEVLTEIFDVALKSEGIGLFDKCLGIILKLRVAKQAELKAQQEGKVTEAEVEEVPTSQRKVARKSSNDSRTTQS